jgi:hypothetical protein
VSTPLLSNGRLRWKCYAPDLVDALRTFDPETTVRSNPPAKKNLVRTVVSCKLGDVRTCLKVHRSRSAWDRLKQRLAPKALLEADLALRLRRLGIPAPEPLAAGWSPEASFLLTREIPGAFPLHDADLPPRLRREACALLGRLLADAHRAHLWHPDLHAGNLLVAPGADGLPWLTVGDLPSARLVPSVSGTMATRSLAMLAASLPSLTRTDRLRGLRAYCGGTLPPRRRLASWIARILAERDAIWKRHWLSRTQRCTRTTGAFIARKEGPLRVVARREFPEGAAAEALAQHRAIQDSSTDSRAVKRDRKTSVTRGVIAGGFRICVKAFRSRRVGTRRARRAWIAANALAERDCPTARPLAWVEHGAAGTLLMEDLSPCRELDRTLAQRWIGMVPKVRRRLIEDLARAFRRLGERGVWPGDAKACNLFVKELPDGGFAFPLVDVDGVRQERPDALEMARALSQLHLSTPRAVGRLARGRFLRTLLGARAPADWREYAELVGSLSAGQGILYQTDAGDVREEAP